MPMPRVPDGFVANRRHVLAMTAAATLTACTPSLSSLVLSDGQSREVDQIARYLDGLRSFQAHFTQTGAFGDGAGTMWLDRPGRLRIEYAGSPPKTLVASNGGIVIADEATGGTTTMPVSWTPLGMLLTPSIRLTGAVTITAYKEDAGLRALTLQKTDAPGQGRLTLVLSPDPMALVGVTLTDAYRRDLVMHISDIRMDPPLPPGLFRSPGA